MLVELLLQVEFFIFIQLQVFFGYLFELGLNFSDLLCAILIQQHSFAVDQPDGFHILLDGLSIKKPDQMHIYELIVPSDTLLRLHADAIQHEVFWWAPFPMRALRCVMMIFRAIWGARVVVMASNITFGKFILRGATFPDKV